MSRQHDGQPSDRTALTRTRRAGPARRPLGAGYFVIIWISLSLGQILAISLMYLIKGRPHGYLADWLPMIGLNAIVTAVILVVLYRVLTPRTRSEQ